MSASENECIHITTRTNVNTNMNALKGRDQVWTSADACDWVQKMQLGVIE